ncbi:MAG: hypothetical protein FJW96_12305, partial [Actinobacteria bacterium]|nr:hypothetical protein [Actinomycetota bacterium]
MRRAAAVLILLLVVALSVGFGFAGSNDRLAAGMTVGEMDVAGREAKAVVSDLEAREERLRREPVVFVAGERKLRLSASQLGVDADWHAA